MSYKALNSDAALRICILPPADLSSESGSTLYAKAVATRLAELEHEVTLVCSVPDRALPVKYIEAPIPLPHPYDDNQGTPSAVFYESIDVTFRALLSHLERNAWDVMHAIYPSINGFAASLSSCLFAIPSVVSCPGRIINLAAYLDQRYRSLAAATFANCDIVIAANKSIKRTIVQEYAYAAERIEVLPMAIDLDEFLRASSQTPAVKTNNAIEFLSVCSCLTEEKGVEVVLNALDRWRQTAPGVSWHYTVIGPDPVAGMPYLRHLNEQCRNLQIQNNVRFLGFVSHSEIANHLKSCSILVDARRVGNFSSVILEALATGTAIVGSDVEANTEFLDGQNGLLFKTDDAESLANCINQLTKSPQVVQELKRAARAWFKVAGERYQFSSHVKALEQIYRAAMSSRRFLSDRNACSSRELNHAQ